jgi:hypothetical protein
MENWYVIAIPSIDLPATLVLDPEYGFPLELSVDTSVPPTNPGLVFPEMWDSTDLSSNFEGSKSAVRSRKILNAGHDFVP